MTSPGAPEAEGLLALGLVEGTRNRHPGQGTANRRFFFHDVMLELLWVEDEAAAGSAPIRRTRLLERWRGRRSGACPFGICLRPGFAGERPPFESWDYRPPWLNGDRAIPVALCSDDAAAPMLFWLEFGCRPDARPATVREPLGHGAGIRELTRVRMTTPWKRGVSAAFEAVVDIGLVALHTGGGYLLELEFDGGNQGNIADMRPALPLRFAW